MKIIDQSIFPEIQYDPNPNYPFETKKEIPNHVLNQQLQHQKFLQQQDKNYFQNNNNTNYNRGRPPIVFSEKDLNNYEYNQDMM